MQVITIINQKGGVGKTTTAHNLSVALEAKNKKVLTIDLDPQCNLSWIYNQPSELTIYDVLQEPIKIKDAIQQSSQGAFINSSEMLAIYPTLSLDRKNLRLKDALEHVKELYDIVIIDTPPSLSAITLNALIASDYALVTAQADQFSLNGVKQLHETIQAVIERDNPHLSLLGFIITRFNPRSKIRANFLNNFEQLANLIDSKVYATKIRESTAIADAQSRKMNIFDFKNGSSNGAKDYQALCDEIAIDLGFNYDF